MDDIIIVPFEPALSAWFGKLNRVWLERYFEIEPIDQQVLDDPQTHVIDHGGHILFATRGDQVLGTCALKHHGDGVYELTKMAVADEAQGLGIGRRLLEAAISAYESAGGARLFLESNDRLKPALKLYETGGFEHVPPPAKVSAYARANVYMEYKE